MLKNDERITDKLIKSCVENVSVTALRDTEMPLLKLKFHKNRLKASWCLLFKNSWFKVGEWPEVKAKTIRTNLPDLLVKLRKSHSACVAADGFVTVEDLLTWYGDRIADDANLSVQRKADVKSAIGCHILPCLTGVKLVDLDRWLLDHKFIQPLRKVLSNGSVKKVFTTLKSAFNCAIGLRKLPEHSIQSMKITDFGNFYSSPKEAQIKPVMVVNLLADLFSQAPMLKMLCMLMLSLGTRVGETRKAKWLHFSLIENGAVWHIPGKDTKTKAPHAIELPFPVVALLRLWREYQNSLGYNGSFVFPSSNHKNHLGHNDASKLLREFTNKEWHYHDLRKCARLCWTHQGVDFLVGERMLNHKLSKEVEPYVDKADGPRLKALVNHCNWLLTQNALCFVLNPSSAANDNNLSDNFSGDVA